MSITTLAELKTALDTETSRSDITWDDYIYVYFVYRKQYASVAHGVF